MQVQFTCNTNIDIKSPTLNEISTNLSRIIKEIVQEFFRQVLLTFANHYMESNCLPFPCAKCGQTNNFIWKTHKGKPTSLLSVFGWLILFQLQIQCKGCKHKMYLTRKLLGIEANKRIPFDTIRKLGLIGSLTTYRVAKKIVGLFGIVLDKMTIWRSVQKLSKEIEFNLDPDECAQAEGDGTGIPIRGIKQRGQELKLLVQLKKKGGVRVAGLAIGKYDGNWDKLFEPLIPVLKTFKKFLLITDGDTSILKGLKGKVDVLFQRCLWHIPHQFKWNLWKDGVKSKSEQWKIALSHLFDIVNTKSIQHNKECIDNIISLKQEHLDKLVCICQENGWKHCKSYLENAKPDMFTALSKRLSGKTTSHAERVMRNINMRINVGKWSPQGALNAVKIRLAYYYNDFDVK